VLEHGGRLRAAASRYRLPLRRWLDLSTGINPDPWPAPAIPTSAWTRLPEEEDGLTDIAQAYYASPSLLPVAGSQAAIQALPGLRGQSKVGVLAPTYAEHAWRWRQAGHEVHEILPSDCAEVSASVDVLLLANPNNPTGHRFRRDELLRWHAQLATRGGWLIVDEAFADPDPNDSLAAECHRDGLIVLRSLGKFFGLPGARVGFVLAASSLLQSLQERLGPWPIPGPSRIVARAALADRVWQAATREHLSKQSIRLEQLLSRNGLAPTGGCELFQWVATPHARRLHEALARRAILTRVFDDPPSLRFGLPGADTDWRRLDQTLHELQAGHSE
jgi:cobalamin biosynthesis protein CobC